ncbi:leucine-rich repeat domain-containing protein, partial [Dehalococcoidia bacterium]|nr:leucine-rich repeat domain-containing protein [Dehalococcoidia bacterium]
MKKRVSLNIFAIVMSALLAFGGVVSAIPASIAVAASPDTPTLADIIANETKEAIPVTVQGVRYYIVTLNRYIDPVSLEVSDDLPHDPLKVFIDAEGNPVRNETTLRRIATVANARQLMQLFRGEGLIEAKIGDIDDILRYHKQIQFLGGVLDVLAAAPGIAISAYLTKGATLKEDIFEGAADFLEGIITDPLNIVKGFVYADLANLKSEYEAALEIQRGEITDFETARRYLIHLRKGLLLRGPAMVALGKIDGLDKSDLERLWAFSTDVMKGIGDAVADVSDFFAGLWGIVDDIADINEKITATKAILDSVKGEFPWVVTYLTEREKNHRAIEALDQEILVDIDNMHIQYTLSLAEAKLRKILVPDLTVSPVSLNPASVNPGGSVSVTFTIRNSGDGPSGAFNNRISLARSKWGTDIFLKSINMDSLDREASRQITVEIPIPRDIRADHYYVTVFTDAFQSITETNEMNNIGTSGDLTPPRLSILETPRIDLTVTSVVAPSNVQAGEAISIRFTVENRGTSPSGTFINEIYLAITPGGTLLPLGELVMDSLDANASKTATAEVTIPSEMPQGAYYVTVFADGHQAVTETVEGNNIGSTYPDRLSIGDPPAEVVIFPDPNLEAAIRDELGIGPGVGIYRSHLERLTELSASNRGISVLTGLEYAVNLTWLGLGDNQISDISPLSGLINLRVLGLEENQITDISTLSGLVNLEWLFLWENQITDISPLSGLVNLQRLYLINNQITDISPLSGMVNLHSLVLEHNHITDISPLSGLVNLRSLELRGNQITDISPLSDLVNLEWLDLRENEITDISSLSNLTNLIWLYLGQNQITDIPPLSGLVNLRVLGLEENQITNISTLSGLVNLVSLELSGNQITDFSPLLALVNLRNLSLSDNQITDISTLSGLVDLGSLDLNHNQITDVSPLSGLLNLQSLELQGNQITDLSPLSGLVNLGGLNLGNNQITDISSLSGLVNLWSLDLDSNQITDISPLSDMVNLGGLNLGNNQITDISPLSGMVNLWELDLGGNQIIDISPLSGMVNLWSLDLHNNQITDISPLSGLLNLWRVDLGNNQITDISALSALTELRMLYLDDNQIADIMPLSGLTKVGEVEYVWWLEEVMEREGVKIHLGLANNQITDISPLVQNEGLSQTDGIDLRGNPLSQESHQTYLPELKARGVEVLYDPPIKDEVVTIPDPNLEAALREELGIEPGVEIYRSDLEQLTRLSASGKGISDLSGLEYAVNMETLSVCRNQISDLSPLSNLTSLTELWLGWNQISDLSPLSNLTNLTGLSLDENQISDLSPLSNLTSLTWLWLGWNQISDL